MEKIKYYGLESHFNEDVVLNKNVEVYGNATFGSIELSNGIITAPEGIRSDNSSIPIKITLDNKTLSFSAVGIGSTYFTLA